MHQSCRATSATNRSGNGTRRAGLPKRLRLLLWLHAKTRPSKQAATAEVPQTMLPAG